MSSDLYHDRLEIPIGGTYDSAGWSVTDRDSTATPPDLFDLTGCTAMCQVRDVYGGTLLAEFNSDGTKPGTITLSSLEEGSNLQLHMASDETSQLAPFSGGVFDVYLFDVSGEPYRLVQGKAHITQTVTEAP